MKSKKVLAAVLTAALLSTSVLAGCGKAPAPTTEPTAQIDADQTINIVGYDYTALDPSVVSDTESFTSLSQVDEGLMTETLKDGKVTNVLSGASDMKKSADGLTYTFTIRDSKWSDGQPVKAQDYEYSWKRLCDPKVSQDYQLFMGVEMGIKGAPTSGSDAYKPDEIGVKATDDKTLVVTLKQPTAYFESTLSFKGLVPQRKDIVDKLGDKYGQDYKNMVFNGPFIISDYAKGSKIVYTKNDNYWDAKNVKLKTANGNIINEPTTAVQMFQNGQLDMVGATKDDLVKLKQMADAGTYDYYKAADPSVFYFIFNTTNKYLKSPKIRLALSLAYNRDQMIQAIWQRYIPAYGIAAPNMTLGDKEYRTAVPEPLKAVKDDPKQLLADGLKDLGLDPDPSKVEFTLWASAASSSVNAQTQFIQSQWQKNLGIKLTIKNAVDSPAYFKERTKGNFDICTGGWGADYNDVTSFFILFTTGNGNNNGKYSNPQYDKLVTDANKESDPAKRTEMFKQAETILVAQDAAVSPYVYHDVQSFRQKYLKGMYIPLFGGYFYLKNVYVQGKSK